MINPVLHGAWISCRFTACQPRFLPVHAAGSSRYTAQASAAALRVTKTDMGSGSERRLQGTVPQQEWEKEAQQAGSVPGILRSQKPSMEGAVGIFSDKVIGLESWKKKPDQCERTPCRSESTGIQTLYCSWGLAKAGLKFQGHIYKPNWLKRLSMWTLQGKSAAHFSEFINTLALARKPWRTQCFSSKCAGIWVSSVMSSANVFLVQNRHLEV